MVEHVSNPVFTISDLLRMEITANKPDSGNPDFPYVTGIIEVALDDVISEKLISTETLMDITYEPVGITIDNLIKIEVSGDVAAVLEDAAPL